MNTHKSHTDTALTEETQKREEKFLLLFFSACIDKIAINSTKRRAEKKWKQIGRSGANVRKVDCCIILLFFMCHTFRREKKQQRKCIVKNGKNRVNAFVWDVSATTSKIALIKSYWKSSRQKYLLRVKDNCCCCCYCCFSLFFWTQKQ